MRTFAHYHQLSKKLNRLLDSLETQLELVGGAAYTASLEEPRQALITAPFKVLVVGEFKRGKSCLTNALLGDIVLPMRVAPCTALITEVNYGLPPKAVLHFQDGRYENIPYEDRAKHISIDHNPGASIEAETKTQTQTSPKNQAPSPNDELSIDNLEAWIENLDFIDLDDQKDRSVPSSDSDSSSSASPRESVIGGNTLRRVILDAPAEICRQGVTLIDSPGLNEDWSRTQSALREMATADALLLVLSCEMALSRTELDFLKTHLRHYAEKLFVLWNRYDAIWGNPEEIGAIESRSEEHLHPIVQADRVLFISAREALLACLNADPARLDRSQLPILQERLERHLLSTQAAPKLSSIAAELRTSCEEGRALIPRMRWLLSQDHTQLERIKVSLEAKITDLEHRLAELKHHISQQKDVLSDLLIAQTDLLSQALYSESAKTAEALRFPDRANRQERKDCVEEFFHTWFVDRMQQFGRTCATEMEKALALLGADIRRQTARFFRDLSEIFLDKPEEKELTASALLEDEQAFDVEEAPQSPKAELRSDDQIWLDEFSLMLQTTPAVLVINAGHQRIAESLSEVRALRGWLMGDRLNEADRRRLSAALVAEFDQQRDHFLDQLKQHVATSFELVSTKLSQQLRRAIDGVRSQLNNVIELWPEAVAAENSPVPENIEDHKVLVEACELQLAAIDSQLSDLLKEIAPTNDA